MRGIFFVVAAAAFVAAPCFIGTQEAKAHPGVVTVVVTPTPVAYECSDLRQDAEAKSASFDILNAAFGNKCATRDVLAINRMTVSKLKYLRSQRNAAWSVQGLSIRRIGGYYKCLSRKGGGCKLEEKLKLVCDKNGKNCYTLASCSGDRYGNTIVCSPAKQAPLACVKFIDSIARKKAYEARLVSEVKEISERQISRRLLLMSSECKEDARSLVQAYEDMYIAEHLASECEAEKELEDPAPMPVLCKAAAHKPLPTPAPEPAAS